MQRSSVPVNRTGSQLVQRLSPRGISTSSPQATLFNLLQTNGFGERADGNVGLDSDQKAAGKLVEASHQALNRGSERADLGFYNACRKVSQGRVTFASGSEMLTQRHDRHNGLQREGDLLNERYNLSHDSGLVNLASEDTTSDAFDRANCTAGGLQDSVDWIGSDLLDGTDRSASETANLSWDERADSASGSILGLVDSSTDGADGSGHGSLNGSDGTTESDFEYLGHVDDELSDGGDVQCDFDGGDVAEGRVGGNGEVGDGRVWNNALERARRGKWGGRRCTDGLEVHAD